MHLLTRILIMGALLVQVLVTLAGQGAAAAAPSSTQIGAPAPDFTLPAVDGGQIRLSDYRGQPLVINFFASWCDPCREEADEVRDLVQGAPAGGYAVLGVAFRDGREGALRFMAEENLELPVGLDDDGAVGRRYRVMGPPATFFLDGKGVIRHQFLGPLTPEQIETGLQAAAGNSPAPGASAGAPGILLAFGLGLLSFLSPCVLPLLPAYLGFISGLSATELTAGAEARRLRVSGRALAFTLGLVLVFTAMGASASLLGGLMTAYRTILVRIAGAAVVILGLHLAGIVRIPLLNREFRPGMHRTGPGGLLGAAGTGAAFALGWTPCVGPVLGTILLLAGQQQTVGAGTMLLLAYGLGLGVPFILSGLLLNQMIDRLKSLHRHLGLVEKVSGLLLIGTGILLLLDKLGALGLWLNQI